MVETGSKGRATLGLNCGVVLQMYEERRRAREDEREARELAEEEAAQRAEQARLKAQDEEADRWMGQIDLQQQGEEAQTEEQAQARPPRAPSLPCSSAHQMMPDRPLNSNALFSQ